MDCLKAFQQKLLVCAQFFDGEVLANVQIAAFDAVGRVLRQVEPAGQIHPFDPVGLSLAPQREVCQTVVGHQGNQLVDTAVDHDGVLTDGRILDEIGDGLTIQAFPNPGSLLRGFFLPFVTGQPITGHHGKQAFDIGLRDVNNPVAPSASDFEMPKHFKQSVTVLNAVETDE